MTRLAIALGLVLALGCGSKAKPAATGAGSGSGPAVMAKKIAVSWGISPQGEMADVYLQTTDETGAQVSHELGRYKGTCEVITPAPEMNALSGVACRAGGGGTELHAVVQGGDQIIVLKMGLDPGVKPDPMAREQVTTIKIPLGIAIEAAK